MDPQPQICRSFYTHCNPPQTCTALNDWAATCNVDAGLQALFGYTEHLQNLLMSSVTIRVHACYSSLDTMPQGNIIQRMQQ